LSALAEPSGFRTISKSDTILGWDILPEHPGP
jgi:hypothetical protein